MEYEFLTLDQRRQVLEERLTRIEVEHYEHEVNRKIGEALAQRANGKQLDEARQMIADPESAQAILETAHEAARAVRAEL